MSHLVRYPGARDLLIYILLVAGCDQCRSQCELAAGDCVERDISEFPDYDAALADLRAAVGGQNCEAAFPFAVAGSCGSGRFLFLYSGGGFTTLAQYYEPLTRRFIALTTTTDVIDPVCLGRGFWPFLIDCPGAIVTEVICGSRFDAGDEVDLP